MLTFDFDGTLSAVVDDPASAVPRPGVVGHLTALADRYRKVGVISGRPVSFLTATLPPGLFLSGLYGMEEFVDGTVRIPDEFLGWEPAVAAAVVDLVGAVDAATSLGGVEVEDKGLSATVHYRRSPGAGPQITALVEQVAAARGLDLRPARMSFELHPPVATDKGSVLHRLVAGLDGVESVVFVGDDVGDLPAFDALAQMRAQGLATVAIAVASSEMDPRVRDRADLVVTGDQVEPLLGALRAGAGTDG